jgi:sortase B
MYYGGKVFIYEKESLLQQSSFNDLLNTASIDDDSEGDSTNGLSNGLSKFKASIFWSSILGNQHEQKKQKSSNYVNIPSSSEVCRLHAKNPDIVGWIKVTNTRINYPVMQTKSEPYFYLHHDLNRKTSNYGVPCLGENTDLSKPSDNLIIYGHHMRNGTMFADLEEYKNKDFFKQNRYIYFNTIEGDGKYEVVAGYKTTVGSGNDEFKYYNFVDASSKEEFDAYVAKSKGKALYDTGVTASYGDKLITLSTCEYSAANGRMVVLAKKVE